MRAVSLALLASWLSLALWVGSNSTVSPHLAGYMGPVELGGGLFVMYKVRPGDFCVLAAGVRNVSIVNFSLRCSAGILVVNSTGVRIAGGIIEGNLSLPPYHRGVGIYIYNSSDVAIYNVTIRGFHDGIYLERCRGVYIRGVHVENSRYGLHVMFSRNITAAGLVAEGNYVGAAVMYSVEAAVVNSTLRRNINWAEGYGLFIADISGGLFSGNYIEGNIHGIYILTMGGWGAGNASVVIARNVVADNYIGLTYRGADVPGYAVVDNVFLGNSMPAVYVDIFLKGGGLKHVVVRGNTWQGHTSTAPYIYRSYFAEALAATDFLLSPLSSSPARFLMDSMGVGSVAFVDPEPKPQPSSIDPAYLAALVAVALLLLARR